MKTIHKNKIRNIVADLVEGCKVEVVTLRKDQKSNLFEKTQQFISFGNGTPRNEIRFLHYLSSDGKTLTINTFYKENREMVPYFSYSFKIILPPGVHLKFTYAPQPLGWNKFR